MLAPWYFIPRYYVNRFRYWRVIKLIFKAYARHF